MGGQCHRNIQKGVKTSRAYEKSISCLEILNTTHDNNFFTRDILFFTHGFARHKGRVIWADRKTCKKRVRLYERPTQDVLNLYTLRAISVSILSVPLTPTT